MNKKHTGGAGLEVFESTLQKTNAWLNDIMAGIDVDDPHLAYLALRAALHALRDRLPVAEAVHLGAQLPMLIRGLYYEGWSPTKKPVKCDRSEFLAAIRGGFRGLEDVDPEDAARVVFAVLGAHISAGEMKDVRAVLPPEIRTLLEGAR